MRKSPVFVLRVAAAFLLLGSVAYLVAMKRGLVEARPGILAALLSGLALLLLGALVLSIRAALRGSRPVAALGEALFACGLLLALLAGLANWLLGVQGTVLLLEREPIRLTDRDALAGLESGPLADPRDREVTIGLARLRMESAGEGRFRAVSQLRVLDADGVESGLEVASDRSAPAGRLVFHQGVFGFAPRIVVTRDGATLLDAHVPFRTTREGPDGMAFVEDLEVAAGRLLLHGAVTLQDLNDEMKGHPTLELAVLRDGEPLGAGTLRPGEFVDLAGGVRVGFAGLKRWSEVLFSRRNYGPVVIGGALAAAIGALAWAAAAWRRW